MTQFQKIFRQGLGVAIGCLSFFVFQGGSYAAPDEGVHHLFSDSDPVQSRETPVDLAADRMTYDDVQKIVTAEGAVELVQDGRILRADRVSYALTSDKVEAVGNVVLNEVTGDTFFADRVELTDKMKNGFVRGLSGMLADGSRFTAEDAEKIADLKIIMNKASYTACEACESDPKKAPPWQLKARNVTHHKDEQRISYDDATLEVLGLPVLYTPYFSHADGTVEQKSGFLAPSVGFDTQLGAFYQQDYYWALAPDKDATFGVVAMTDELPLVLGEYRQRFDTAEIKVNSGITYSSRTDRINNTDRFVDEEERGHFMAEGRWDIDEKWRAGTDIALVTDDQYMRQYNITNKDVLENKIYVERFSGRHYATGRLIRFKDIRVSDRAEDQPNVLPEIYTSFTGAPNGLLGGRWKLENSVLALQREGQDQDVYRTNMQANWQRRHVMDMGLVNTLDLTARGAFYQIQDNEILKAQRRDDNPSAARGFVQAHYEAGYPLQKNVSAGHIVMEPKLALTAGTSVNPEEDIPNEDSQDIFLSSNNLFRANRFPGYDRIEDRTRATYGLRSGYYADDSKKGEVFVGQSYRFNNQDNPFADGSGLSEQESDLVGQVGVDLGNAFSLDYGLQLDNDRLTSRRHEVDTKSKIGSLTLGARYFYINALEGTDLTQSREQIRNSIAYDLTEEWRVFGASQYDLSKQTEGLRALSYGLDYTGQCVTFMLQGSRQLTNDSSGDSGLTLMMRLGLKNLGEFETSGVTLDARDEE